MLEHPRPLPDGQPYPRPIRSSLGKPRRRPVSASRGQPRGVIAGPPRLRRHWVAAAPKLGLPVLGRSYDANATSKYIAHGSEYPFRGTLRTMRQRTPLWSGHPKRLGSFKISRATGQADVLQHPVTEHREFVARTRALPPPGKAVFPLTPTQPAKTDARRRECPLIVKTRRNGRAVRIRPNPRDRATARHRRSVLPARTLS
jgi:hypothetical protein